MSTPLKENRPPASPRRLASVALLVCLLMLAMVGVAACGSGGGESSSDLKTYTDADYGYSFQYPAGWELKKGGTADVTAGGSAVSSVGVYDPKGAVAEDTYIDLAQVSVYKLNVNVDQSMMPDIRAEVEQVLASLESQSPDMKTVERLSETNVGGMPGFQVTYSFTKNGAPTTSTLYFLFKDNLEYQVTVQAATQNWQAKQAVFKALVASFRPGPAD